MSVTLEHRAYAHLQQKLLNRSLASGVAFPEAALDKEVGVRRTPMRQALETRLALERYAARLRSDHLNRALQDWTRFMDA